MKKIQMFFLCIFLFCIFSCNVKKAEENPAKPNPDTNAKQSEDKKQELIPVEAINIKKGDISSYLLLSANLETEQMTDVYSRVQGWIKRIHFEEGDYVEKGSILLELNAEDYELAEKRARILYEQSKNACERCRGMYQKNLKSLEDYEESKFMEERSKVEWQQAQLTLSYTKIAAPISGFVGERFRRRGDLINTSDKLLTLINTNEMIAIIHVPERQILNIHKGQKALLEAEYFKQEKLEAWVKRISPAVDAASGTFRVVVGLQNPQNKLKPGMFVNIHIILDTHVNTVLVPKKAIVYENENQYVFLVKNSQAHKTKVFSGYQTANLLESLSGIEEGDQIIVVGQANLKDKANVKVVSPKT